MEASWFSHDRGVSRAVCVGVVVLLICAVWVPVAQMWSGGDDTQGVACPANMAGEFVAGWDDGEPTFYWYKFFGKHTMGAGDTLTFSFAFIPFDGGTLQISLDESVGRTGYQFTIADDFVTGGVPYRSGAWNRVSVQFDFGTKQMVVTVNGIASAPQPFKYADSNSVQAFRVWGWDVEPNAVAWFDAISVVKSSGGTETLLFEATFDNDARYTASKGTITALEPPDTYALPAVCTSIPTLELNPHILKFNAVEGNDPDPQSIFVAGSALLLSWTASEEIPWLVLSSEAGTTPAAIAVSVDVDGLDPGLYSGQILVNSEDALLGGAQVIYVSLLVAPAAPLPSGPCPLNLAGKLVTGWDGGDPDFQWYEYFGAHALSATDTLALSFAIVPFGSGNTLVALDESGGRTGYSLQFADGLVNGLVPYVAGDWNNVEAVFDFAVKQYVVTVNGIASAPQPFSFATSESVQSLRVHVGNANEETFAWFDEISVAKVSGDSRTLLWGATFDDGAAYLGYPGTITALEPPDGYTAPSACQVVTTLDVSPNLLEFTAIENGDAPASQSFFISSTTEDPLSWTASESTLWLSLSLASGTSPAEVVVSVDPDGLAPGLYREQIVLISDDATLGSPQSVYVSLLVSPETLPPSDACPSNLAGEFATGWDQGEPAFQWYEFSFVAEFGTEDMLELSFVTVPFGSGKTLVALDDGDGRTAFGISFENGLVNGALPYTPDNWNSVEALFNFATKQYVLTVNGVASAPFPFSFADADSVHALRVHAFQVNTPTSAWFDALSVRKISGGVETVIFEEDFDEGVSYPYTVGTISALEPPSDYVAPLVCGVDALEVAPLSLSFQAVEGASNPEAASLFIQGTGTDPLTWQAIENVSWLSLSTTAGTTPAEVAVTIDIGGLAAGLYNGTITVFSEGAYGSPRTVKVHLLVKPSQYVPIALVSESGYNNIRLQWNPTNDPQVTGYRIARRAAGADAFAPLVEVDTLSYLDTDPALVTGATYSYTVFALRTDNSVAMTSTVGTAVFGRVSLWVPDTWAAQGETTVIPVRIRNAQGLRIAAGDIWMDFDSGVIALLDVAETPLTAGYTWTYAITSTGTYSQVRIATLDASPAALYGEGAFFWLTVQVLGEEGEESPLNLREFITGVGGSTLYTPEDPFNPVPLELENGVFHVASGGMLGDLNGNGVVQAVDAYIALQIAAGQLVPTAEQLLVGDINGNGKIDAADATEILYYAAHGSWPSPTASEYARPLFAAEDDPVLLSLDDVWVSPGGSVKVTLSAEDLANWAGGEFSIVYDNQIVVGIITVEAIGLASDFALEYYDIGTGLLHMALSGSVPVSGSGPLVAVTLQVAEDLAVGAQTPLRLAEVALHDVAGRDFATSALQRHILRAGGTLQIGTQPVTPSLYLYLPMVLK